MGARGPAPLPAEVLRRRGTLQRARVHPLGSRPGIAPGEAPGPPPGLTTDGRKLWADLAPHMAESGVLSEGDLPALYVACELWGGYRQLAKRVYRDPLTRRARTIAEAIDDGDLRVVQALNRARADVMRALSVLGLTPSARRAVGIILVPPSNGEGPAEAERTARPAAPAAEPSGMADLLA